MPHRKEKERMRRLVHGGPQIGAFEGKAPKKGSQKPEKMPDVSPLMKEIMKEKRGRK